MHSLINIQFELRNVSVNGCLVCSPLCGWWACFIFPFCFARLRRSQIPLSLFMSAVVSYLQEPSHADCNEQFVFEDMQVMSDFELHNLCKNYSSTQKYSLTDEDILSSGKFQYLDQLLPQIKAKVCKISLILTLCVFCKNSDKNLAGGWFGWSLVISNWCSTYKKDVQCKGHC